MRLRKPRMLTSASKLGSSTEARTSIWDKLEEKGVARFPFPPHGRIPNFADASEAADRLASDATAAENSFESPEE